MSHKAQPHVLDRHQRGIKRDYSAFKRDGKDKTKAAKYHSVIRGPVFQIELDHVCPPYLHIVLGIMRKYHSPQEEKCYKLDKKITNCLTRQEEEPDIDKSTHFGKHVRHL